MKVLCFSPQAENTTQAMREITILHGLRVRGAEIKYLLCDGIYSHCDIFWESVRPRTPDSCEFCMGRTKQIAYNMDMPFEWIGQYISPEEKEIAEQWAQEVAPEDFMTATYQDWIIGEWVESSVHSYLRMSDLDLNDPKVLETYRGYLKTGLLTCFGLTRAFDQFQPDLLFIFNGRVSSLKTAWHVAKLRGIPFLCHEMGWQLGTLRLFDNTSCDSLYAYWNLWPIWGDIPLETYELEQIVKFMAEREVGGQSVLAFLNPLPQALSEVRKKLDLKPERPVWSLYTSSDDEVIAAPEWRGTAFERQRDWIHATIDYAREHDDIDLVIRTHPNTGGKKTLGKNVAQLEEFERIKKDLPSNVRLIMPEEKISSYSLMNLSTVGIIYNSTVSLEMACKGKHVIAAAGAVASNLPFINQVESAESYTQLLDEARQLPLMAYSSEVQRLAYRYAFGIYFRWDIPFPLVKMPSMYKGKLTYRTPQELAPGKDEGLDRVCRALLEGESVYQIPTDEDKNRTEEDEIRYFQICTKNMVFQQFFKIRSYSSTSSEYILSKNMDYLLKPRSELPGTDAILADITPTLIEKADKEVLDKSSLICVPSQSAQDKLIQTFPSLQEKINILPYYIPEIMFYDEPLTLDLDITDKRFKCLSIFSAHDNEWQKSLSAFIQAFPNQSDVIYILVPYGDTLENIFEKLETWMQNMNFDEDSMPEMELLNYQELGNDIRQLYSIVDLYIQCDPNDLAQMHLLQAMTQNIKVLSTLPMSLKPIEPINASNSSYIAQFQNQLSYSQLWQGGHASGRQWNAHVTQTLEKLIE